MKVYAAEVSTGSMGAAAAIRDLGRHSTVLRARRGEGDAYTVLILSVGEDQQAVRSHLEPCYQVESLTPVHTHPRYGEVLSRHLPEKADGIHELRHMVRSALEDENGRWRSSLAQALQGL
jgi:hypothetical protein